MRTVPVGREFEHASHPGLYVPAATKVWGDSLERRAFLMKRSTGIIPKIEELRKKSRGDSLNVAHDREALEALLEATRRHYEREDTEEARERYEGVKEALETLDDGV